MGKMVRCPEGHFYDTEKHSACPWCAKPLDLGGGPSGESEKTKKLDPSAATPAPAPAPIAQRPSGAVTRRLDLTEEGLRPVVGWLVCVEGPDKGRDFRLHSEKNFIGRDSTMDISLAKDESVSRHRHAVLTFEPKKRTFWLEPGESGSLVYLDEEIVNTPRQINAYQVVELAKTKLVLVPFDNEKFPLF